MSEITQDSPAAAPYEPDRLTRLTKLLKEPLRQLVAAVAEDIYVKGAPDQVKGTCRHRAAGAYEIELRLERAATGGDDEWYAYGTVHIEDPDGAFTGLGFEVNDVLDRRVEHAKLKWRWTVISKRG